MNNSEIRASVRERSSSLDVSTFARPNVTARVTLDKVDERQGPSERAVDSDLVGRARYLDQHAIGRAQRQLLDDGVVVVPADHRHRRSCSLGGKINAGG